jgi:hypothetical protein
MEVSAMHLYILNFGNDEYDSSRYFLHEQLKTVDEFEEDRLSGAVTEEQVLAEDMDGIEVFAEQIARLRAKGYVEVNTGVYCHVTDGYTEEL